MDALDQLIDELRVLGEERLVVGTAGNASVRQDGRVLLSRTGGRLGRSERDDFAELDQDGRHIGGALPSKEHPLHTAIYARDPRHDCVIHLHSTYSVAVACLPAVDALDVFPPLTPYSVMKVGKVPLLPYHRPGASSVMRDIERCAVGTRAALLGNHGMIVWGSSPAEVAAIAVELEELARLTIILAGTTPRVLDDDAVAELRRAFPSSSP